MCKHMSVTPAELVEDLCVNMGLMYLINLVEHIYAWNVDSAALYAVHQVVHITVFLQVDICIVYPVL